MSKIAKPVKILEMAFAVPKAVKIPFVHRLTQMEHARMQVPKMVILYVMAVHTLTINVARRRRIIVRQRQTQTVRVP